MNVQTMNRQALLNKLTSVINRLPEEQLQQAWEQLERWETMAAVQGQKRGGQRAADSEDGIEFDVTPQPLGQRQSLRLPIRSTGPVSKAVMTVGDTVDRSGFIQQLQANVEWWNQHYAMLCQDATLYGRYVAVSNGELFSGDTYREAYNKARAVQADAAPYIFFLKAPNESSYAVTPATCLLNSWVGM